MKNRKKKLVTQIALIILPLFVVMIVGIAWSMYRSAVNGFLKAENTYMAEDLEEIADYNILSFESYPEREKELLQFLPFWEQEPLQMRAEMTDDDYLALDEIYEGNIDPDLYYEWISRLSDENRRVLAKQAYEVKLSGLRFDFEKHNYDRLFLLDMRDPYIGMVLCDFGNTQTDKQLGEYFNYDIRNDSGIQQILQSQSDEIVFSKSKNMPENKNYYIAYKPIYLDGELSAVIGIAYQWDDFNDDIISTLKIAALFSIAVVLLSMIILHFLLYRKVIRPVSNIQGALVQYTDDKDSKKIVKEMYDIKSKNEIGQLADIISDLALELDLYTKENVRIATEQERTEKELYEAKVQIMVSQIRPHFMYNTLSSIAMLCKLNPDTAYTAAINFSDYLRCNMDSLKQTAPVPFSKELDHLKKYLYIEKLRFDDLLNVEYDIQATDFKVPLLSIQPIVENAVKHGVGMKEDGGTVKISTRETETAYEIIVSDDGVGFDTSAPKKEDGRSHVGMENTKKRLKDMCNADIVITSKVGEGTTATITIPKIKNEEEPES